MEISPHAVEMAETKGFDLKDVAQAALEWDIRYPANNHAGQEKRINTQCTPPIVAIVDPDQEVVITVFEHMTRTPLRPDQKAS